MRLGRIRRRQPCAIHGHDQSDNAVDFVFCPLFSRIDVFLGVLVTGHVREHPGQHPIPVVMKTAVSDGRFNFLHRSTELKDCCSTFNHRNVLPEHSFGELCRLEGVVRNLNDIEPAAVFQQL